MTRLLALSAVALLSLAACDDSGLQGAAFQPRGAETATPLDDQSRLAVSLIEGETAQFPIEVPAGMGMLDVELLGDPGASITLYAGGVPVCISGDSPRCTVSWPAPGTWTVSVDADQPSDDAELTWRFSTSPPATETPAPQAPPTGSSSGSTPPSTAPQAPAEDDLVCDVDPASMPEPDGCVTQYVQCGDVIEGTLEGGSNVYGYQDWADRQMIGGLTNDWQAVEGPERVFVVTDLQPGQHVTAIVESCDDVWASWTVHGDMTDVCEMGWGPAGHFESDLGRVEQHATVLNTASGDWDVELIVDGHPGATTSFRLTVTCG
ncbi:MAG: hypothetical protein KC656_03765 [Myxococcales bacterium]|nr:hypothetical protein [Myxococcales bacterium]MCB9670904.1 hypothetical protein [Alphaproteobacteria bacterium]MCB9691137.1 hypothetical protein [Alphaproteobacteria bacterium]